MKYNEHVLELKYYKKIKNKKLWVCVDPMLPFKG